MGQVKYRGLTASNKHVLASDPRPTASKTRGFKSILRSGKPVNSTVSTVFWSGRWESNPRPKFGKVQARRLPKSVTAEVASSSLVVPALLFKHLQKTLHPGVGTKRYQKGTTSTRPAQTPSSLYIPTPSRRPQDDAYEQPADQHLESGSPAERPNRASASS